MPPDPRLVDVGTVAVHLGGVSETFVRALVRRGELVPVRLPPVRPGGAANRRLLFDLRDVDALIDRWKAQSTSTPNTQPSSAALKGWRQSPDRRKKGAA